MSKISDRLKNSKLPDKEITCSKCGSNYIGKRQRKDSICNSCLNLYYKELRDINAKESIVLHRNGGESEWLKKWVTKLVEKTLGVSGEEQKILADAMLKKLVEQDFKCYYTGLPLVPGLNASIEHIMPKSKKPELRKDIDNLVWVRREINAMKNNYGFNEFINFCELCANSPVLLQLAQSEKEEAEILQYEDYVI